jgi:serine/threonine protein phosphatase PrpC
LLHNSNKINNQKYNSTSPDSENESDNSFDSDCENELYNNNITNDDVNNINLNKFIANDMGTTANIVLITPSHIYISNVGDSLSVMYKNNQAIQLNQEHKTTLKSEYDRIQKSGEFIINNRIKGKLNLTRAIGDFQFKSSPHLKFYEQSVIAFPEITKIKRTDDINYIIMGCDGVWDCVEKQGLCEEIDKICNKQPNKMLSNIIFNCVGGGHRFRGYGCIFICGFFRFFRLGDFIGLYNNLFTEQKVEVRGVAVKIFADVCNQACTFRVNGFFQERSIYKRTLL